LGPRAQEAVRQAGPDGKHKKWRHAVDDNDWGPADDPDGAESGTGLASSAPQTGTAVSPVVIYVYVGGPWTRTVERGLWLAGPKVAVFRLEESVWGDRIGG